MRYLQSNPGYVLPLEQGTVLSLRMKPSSPVEQVMYTLSLNMLLVQIPLANSWMKFKEARGALDLSSTDAFQQDKWSAPDLAVVV